MVVSYTTPNRNSWSHRASGWFSLETSEASSSESIFCKQRWADVLQDSVYKQNQRYSYDSMSPVEANIWVHDSKVWSRNDSSCHHFQTPTWGLCVLHPATPGPTYSAYRYSRLPKGNILDNINCKWLHFIPRYDCYPGTLHFENIDKELLKKSSNYHINLS